MRTADAGSEMISMTQQEFNTHMRISSALGRAAQIVEDMRPAVERLKKSIREVESNA